MLDFALSFPRKRESMFKLKGWMPLLAFAGTGFAGMTGT